MSYLYWSRLDGRVGGLGFTLYLDEVEVEE
jgi:hypothetical protein